MDGKILYQFKPTDRVEAVPGLAMAVLPGNESKEYYQGLNLGRDFETAYQNRIVKAIQFGYVGDGINQKWDDRKARFSGLSLESVASGRTTVTIQVGPTHFLELRDIDLNLVKEAQEKSLDSIAALDTYQKLVEKGETDFSDPGAYFARVFSVNGVPVTNDGTVHVVKRDNKVEIYPGAFHVIGGQYDVGDSLARDLFQPQAFQRRAKERISSEFSEEAGVEKIGAELIALIEGVNIELAHVVHVPVDSQTFLKYLEQAKDIEHDDVFSFSHPEQLSNFLRTEKSNFVPSGLSALEESLRRHQEGSINIFSRNY